jgi:CO dehydrogenase maturation factor
MKVMICGKGGSGKSTITTLLARALKKTGKTVLIVDTDESNLCLHRLLGANLPEALMENMGGRKGAKEKLHPPLPHNHKDDFFQDAMTFADLPASCLADVEGIKLLVVGKIREYGEGCACMIGGISKAVLSRLREGADEVVLIDAEAGLEHFGRRVDAGCDLILAIIDPSFESIQMADRTRHLAESAGIQAFFILNKVDDTVREAMEERLDPEKIIASIPRNDALFLQSLHGDPLTVELKEIEVVCRFIQNHRKPMSLAMRL